MMRRFAVAYVITVVGLCIAALTVLGVYIAAQIRADIQVTEATLAGVAAHSRTLLAGTSRANLAAHTPALEDVFGMPVQPLSQSALDDAWPAPDPAQLTRGQVLALGAFDDAALLVVNTDAGLIAAGPIPDTRAPPRVVWLIMLGIMAAAAALLGWIFGRPWLARMRHIESVARRISAGALDARIDAVYADEPFAQAFNVMAERTAHTIAQQRVLMQTVSHELRTPLQRVRLGLEALPGAGATAVNRDLDALEHLVAELLQFVRVQDGATLERACVHVDEVAADVAAEAAPLLADLDVALAGPDLSVMADPALFARALRNLVDNARKHARSAVHIGWATRDGHVHVWVDDDGPGIPAAQVAHALAPFQQLSPGDGAGLGLALVAGILARHGGTVTIAQAPLGGARVCTSWPVEA